MVVGNGQVGNKGSSRKQPGRERGGGEIIGNGGLGEKAAKPGGETVRRGGVQGGGGLVGRGRGTAETGQRV